MSQSQDKQANKLLNSETEYGQEEKKPQHKELENEKSFWEERPGKASRTRWGQNRGLSDMETEPGYGPQEQHSRRKELHE